MKFLKSTKQSNIFPDWIHNSFNVASLDSSNVDFNQVAKMPKNFNQHFKKDLITSGFLEKRHIYFANKNIKQIHKGVDFFVNPETELFNPAKGVLKLALRLDPLVDFSHEKHSGIGTLLLIEVSKNDLPITIQRHLTNFSKVQKIYCEFMHLSIDSLNYLSKLLNIPITYRKINNQYNYQYLDLSKQPAKIPQKTLLGWVGNFQENGNWPIHLHWQIILVNHQNQQKLIYFQKTLDNEHYFTAIAHSKAETEDVIDPLLWFNFQKEKITKIIL